MRYIEFIVNAFIKQIYFKLKSFIFRCTMRTSDTELILSTYIVTPTSTGGPEMLVRLKRSCYNFALFKHVCLIHKVFSVHVSFIHFVLKLFSN